MSHFRIVCFFISLHLVNQSVSGQWTSIPLDFENQQLQITLSDDRLDQVKRVAKGIPIAEMLHVRLDMNQGVEVLGKTRFIEKENLFTFQPRFPFDPGTKLVIEFRHKDHFLGRTLFVIPQPQKRKITRINEIYPSGKQLPANLLKFYLHFSGPMQTGNIYRHFSILETESGKQVEIPFLELEQELWSRDRTRLTLFLDPGRIKRGLKPRKDLGPIFLPKKSYELRISGKWKDVAGNELGPDVVKSFAVFAEDHQTPDIKKWQILTPQAETTDPLVIEFDESLDAALLRRVLQLQFQEQVVDLKDILLAKNERRISLLPERPWKAGTYRLEIGPELEDLCGNRIGKPFDVDLQQGNGAKGISDADPPKKFELRFQVPSSVKK